MEGRIIKGIGGFYYVKTPDGVCECKARGAFRNEGVTPLVGDFAEVEKDPDRPFTGQIVKIKERKNEILRPKAANADAVFLLFSSVSPKPSFEVLNRYLAVSEERGIPVSLVVTKTDLASEESISEILSAFSGAPYPMHFCSSFTGEGIPELKEALAGKLTVFAGPSGVGKSSLINALLEKKVMEVGALSKKIERGKNTTRHAELFPLGEDSFLLDTPGFTSVDYDFLVRENLALDFPEFIPFLTKCRFSSCTHRTEEGCEVRKAAENGAVSLIRYRSYVEMLNHLYTLRRY